MSGARLPILVAPGAPSGSGALRLPRHDAQLPAVDAPLVEPGTRQEMIDGQMLYAQPANEPHATLHLDLASVLRAHVAMGWLAAVDMLTRTGMDTEFAPDASVFPAVRDPVTGGRRLEELAFEIVSEQPMSVATGRARKLAARGVRRVFAIVVKTKRAYEYVQADDAWQPLAPTAVLSDRCFVQDLPVRALVEATAVDTAIAKALLVRGHPVIEQALVEREARGEARGRTEGVLEAKRELLLRLLASHGVELTSEHRDRIAACGEVAVLDAWLDTAMRGRCLRSRGRGCGPTPNLSAVPRKSVTILPHIAPGFGGGAWRPPDRLGFGVRSVCPTRAPHPRLPQGVTALAGGCRDRPFVPTRR